MLKGPTKSTGFAVPTHERAAYDDSALPVLVTLSLVLSIAVVLTVVTVNAARAAHLF